MEAQKKAIYWPEGEASETPAAGRLHLRRRLRDGEKIRFCCLSHLVLPQLLWEPWKVHPFWLDVVLATVQ